MIVWEYRQSPKPVQDFINEENKLDTGLSWVAIIPAEVQVLPVFLNPSVTKYLSDGRRVIAG